MPFIGNQPAKVPLTSADITDGIITSAKIADGTIVNADINASAAIDSTKLSGSFGITEADMWRMTADINTNADPISSNLERVDNASFAKIGTGMSVSSGIWTFPTTGLYKINFFGVGEATNENFLISISATLNNSTYSTIANVYTGMTGNQYCNCVVSSFVNVTNTSNVKVKFVASSFAGTSATILFGSTDYNFTYFEFIRLGDSQ